jgi:hypothetical protein
VGCFPRRRTEPKQVPKILLTVWSCKLVLLNTVTISTVDLFKAYFKQAREELSVRLCDRVFEADGTKSKWWQVRSACLLPIFRLTRANLVHCCYVGVL